MPGSYPSVTRHLHAIRGPRFTSAPAASTRIVTAPGEECQFDWSDVSAWTSEWGLGEVWCFSAVLSWSRMRIWWFAPFIDREHTLEGLVRFFESIGGVHRGTARSRRLEDGAKSGDPGTCPAPPCGRCGPPGANIDLVVGTVRVERSLWERRNGDVIIGPPKSSAGVRTAHMPRSALRVLGDHLEHFVGSGRDAWLFVGRTDQPLRPRGIEDAWRSARDEIGLPDMRFHDLRHFAGTMAAATGASTKEVMARGGWSSPQACASGRSLPQSQSSTPSLLQADRLVGPATRALRQ